MAALSAALAAFLIGAAPAAAANRFAAPGETDTSPCTAANPCDIQAAVEFASSGDDVTLLDGGTYEIADDPLFVGFGADTTVHGPAPGDRVRIEATSGFVQIFSGAVLQDVEIENTSGGAPLDVRENSTAERVFVRSALSSACSVSDGSVLRDSVCWNTSTTGSAAVRAQASPGATVTANLRNVTAVATDSGSRAVEAITFGAGDAKILATNVIAQGGTPASGGADVRAATDDATGAATVDLNHSNYDTIESDGVPGSENVTDPAGTNQTPAPLFANAAAGNFHEQAGSPTRNAGITSAANGPLDIDGQLRAQGSTTDIGADEFDQVAPNTTITGGPSGTTPDSTPTFIFSSNEPGSFQCAIDGAAFASCSGPGASHTTGLLAHGAHTFRVRATDVSGNVEPSPAQRSFTVVDATAPDTAIDKGPKKKSKKRKAKFRFSSNDPSATFECRLDKKDFKACTSPKKYKKLKRRKHKFRVRAIDAAGNVDATPDLLKWKVKKRR